MKNSESVDEPAVNATERFNRLRCHINIGTNYMVNKYEPQRNTDQLAVRFLHHDYYYPYYIFSRTFKFDSNIFHQQLNYRRTGTRVRVGTAGLPKKKINKQ